MLVICVYIESFLTVHGVVTDCGLEKSSSRSHIADLPLSQMSLWAASSNWFASSEWLENLRPISNFEANQVQFSSREANFILQLRPRFNLSLYFATRLAEHFSDQHRSKTDASKSQNSGQKWGTELASKQASKLYQLKDVLAWIQIQGLFNSPTGHHHFFPLWPSNTTFGIMVMMVIIMVMVIIIVASIMKVKPSDYQLSSSLLAFVIM